MWLTLIPIFIYFYLLYAGIKFAARDVRFDPSCEYTIHEKNIAYDSMDIDSSSDDSFDSDSEFSEEED
jgi:hypothetical protein